jgi:hypothetical protein
MPSARLSLQQHMGQTYDSQQAVATRRHPDHHNRRRGDQHRHAEAVGASDHCDNRLTRTCRVVRPGDDRSCDKHDGGANHHVDNHHNNNDNHDDNNHNYVDDTCSRLRRVNRLDRDQRSYGGRGSAIIDGPTPRRRGKRQVFVQRAREGCAWFVY